jgi:hypothetical protein
MDTWYSILRNLKDESQDPRVTEQFCHRVFQDLKHSKIRDKKKFRQRTGAEFDTWALSLELVYPKPTVIEILNDDSFWTATLQHTIGV